MTGQPAAPASLAEALAALQANMPAVSKTADGQYGKYADLTVITEALYPVMSALGLSFTAMPTTIDDGARFVLDYQLIHVSGETKSGLYPLPAGGTPQSLGSAITYARRYSLCAVTGLAPGGDDDDGDSAQRTAAKARDEKAPARKSRAVPDTQLASEGRMTRRQKADHEQMQASTLRGNGKADRSRPRQPDPGSDPWAVDAPVDRHRARALREHIDRNPEDRPGTISEGQHRAIERMLGMLGFKPAERKDRHGHAALRLGLDQLPVNPASAPDSGPSMLGLSAAQAAALIRALQDDLDDLKNAEADA